MALPCRQGVGNFVKVLPGKQRADNKPALTTTTTKKKKNNNKEIPLASTHCVIKRDPNVLAVKILISVVTPNKLGLVFSVMSHTADAFLTN